jgi:YVTN family beta-propeller protein
MKFPGSYLTTAATFLLLCLTGPSTNGAGGSRYLPDSSSTILLSRDEQMLFVSNPDSGSVSVVDVGSTVKLAEIPVGRTPRTMALSADGGRLLVACQDSNHVAVIDTSALEVQQFIDVSAEPYGVVTGPRGHYAYVTSSALGVVDVIHFGGDSLSLETFDNGDLLREKPDLVRARYNRVVRSIQVESKPAGVARSADGQRLYVTHLRTGHVSVIHLNRRSVIEVIGTGTDSNMSQQIAIHPDNGRAYLPHIRSNVTNRFRLFDSTVFPAISVIDLATGTHLARERIDLSLGVTVANLPYDIRFSTDGRQIYVVNLGSGDVMVHDIETGRRVASIDVGPGPRGIAVSADGLTGYVNNSMTGEVSILDLRQYEETARIPVTEIPLPEDVQRGKIVFFSSQSPEVSRDRWMSCASCHFEAEHDGRTWFTELGPRNTTSLGGSGQTRPLHWSADRDEIQDFEHTIRDLQAGAGLLSDGTPHLPLGLSNAGQSPDLDAMAAYVNQLKPKRSPFSFQPERRRAITRGRDLFMRPDIGCAGCHPPPRYTDSTTQGPAFVRHDVGTGGGPDEKFGPEFDTPTLNGLWDSAPYFHDGSAATLKEVIGGNDRHGRTSHLIGGERTDLIAFLLSL